MLQAPPLLARVDAGRRQQTLAFIDVFAGCGGLSLGLMRAGWKGLFAVEKDRFAFETLMANLVERDAGCHFEWPAWLAKAPHCVMSLLATHAEQLAGLEGHVDLLAGGPPCQGFSSAGRRDASDPRNALMQGYLELVSLVKPKLVLIENVHGITVDFVDKDDGSGRINYAQKLIDELSIHYTVNWRMIDVSEFGVPQARSRFFLIAHRKDLPAGENPFELLFNGRQTFLETRGLRTRTSARSAISDLEVKRNGKVPCPDSPGFKSINYSKPRTKFQRLMRAGARGSPNSTRLAQHRPDIVKRFKKIITQCHKEGRLNRSISKEMREMFGLKKMALRVLDPNRPSPTITSMPDDLLHYKEPRTLTVRENARLQSFPDWFEFRGKYTTGGHLRKKEVPRFTQVANAVPPLMAQALGHAMASWLAAARAVQAARADETQPSTRTSMAAAKVI